MSSLKQIFRPLFLLAFLALLSGCGFQPLYGKRAENPLPQLASIKIHPIADRTGQILRNYLLNELTPRGQPRNPKYILFVEVTESLGSYGIQKDDTATRAILKLREAGYAVVVITSQSCVGFGYVSRGIINMVHERLCQLLVEEAGNQMAQPDAIFFSTGAGERAVHPTLADHSLNKPAPVLLKQAETLLALNPQNAWLVGDRLSDLQAGLAYGATPVLVRTGAGRQTENKLEPEEIAGLVICDNLVTAADYILGHSEA